MIDCKKMLRVSSTKAAINTGYGLTGIHPEYYFGGPYGTVPHHTKGGRAVKRSTRKTKGGKIKTRNNNLAMDIYGPLLNGGSLKERLKRLKNRISSALTKQKMKKIRKKFVGYTQPQISEAEKRQMENNIMRWDEQFDLPSELQEENATRLMERPLPPPPPEEEETPPPLPPRQGVVRTRETVPASTIFYQAPKVTDKPPSKQKELTFEEQLSEQRGKLKKVPERVAGVDVEIPPLMRHVTTIDLQDGQEDEPSNIVDDVDEWQESASSTTDYDPYTDQILEAVKQSVNKPDLPLGPDAEIPREQPKLPYDEARLRKQYQATHGEEESDEDDNDDWIAGLGRIKRGGRSKRVRGAGIAKKRADMQRKKSAMKILNMLKRRKY